MSDLISREALFESLEKEQEIYENNGAIPSFWTALSVIRHAPTVKTEQWIPCSGCTNCQHKECKHHGKV